MTITDLTPPVGEPLTLAETRARLLPADGARIFRLVQ